MPEHRPSAFPSLDQPTLPPAASVLGETLSPGPVAERQDRVWPSVPGYEILAELGRGGMGVVYKARQVKANRLVALKMILTGGHAGDAERARFQIEAEAVARLQHPGIVQVFEVGEHDGLPFFSLEFCPGGSLEKKLAGTPLPPADAAALVEQVARAVHSAHEHRIIHRDLKPANVLLTADGKPKVTDFGLAKKLDEAGQTASGSIMGTPSYMAPEQAEGRGQEIGPATDVYALGAILYEALTGRPPFRAATALDTILQVVSVEPVPPRQLNPRIPPDLETICLKCLQKDPRRRYASALALADDLYRFREGEPIQARPVGPLERAVRWARRRPALAGLAAVSALLAALGLGLVLWNWRDSVLDHQREVEQLARTEAALERAQLLLYANALAQAEREWRDSNTDQARRVLATCPSDLRGWEWHYGRRLYQGDLLTLAGHSDTVTGVACSADGELLASACADGLVRLWDARSGQLRQSLVGHQGPVTAVAFAPDGRSLASAGRDGQVLLWETQSSRRVRSLTGHAGAILAVAFSQDGRSLASGGEDRTARVWNPADGQAGLVLSGHDHFVTGVAFHPNSPWLATGCADNVVRVWDLTAPARQLVLRGHSSEVRGVAFSPDGRQLASVSWDKLVKLWDPATGRHLGDLTGHTQGVYSVAFSPDGTWLASASGDRTARVWELAARRTVRTLPGHSHFVTCVAFSPDSRRLVVARNDRTVKVWDLTHREPTLNLAGLSNAGGKLAFQEDGERLLQRLGDVRRVWDVVSGEAVEGLTRPEARAEALPFRTGEPGLLFVRVGDGEVELSVGQAEIACVVRSPDGSRLATGSRDGTVRLWDARTGQPTMTLAGSSAGIIDLAFGPRGHRLAMLAADGEVRIWDATPLAGTARE